VNGTELERYTFDVLGEPFIKAALRSPYDARREAREECKRFSAAEAANVFPNWARGAQQALLASAAEMHGLEAPPMKAGGFWNYREIRGAPATGGPAVILTAATVGKPCGFIRVADYQRTLAESGQGRLFGEIQPGDCVYALLLTSRYRGVSLEDARDNRHLPGSVYMAWPSNDCLGYVHVVNLVERYPEIVRQYLPELWTERHVMMYIQQSRRMAF